MQCKGMQGTPFSLEEGDMAWSHQSPHQQSRNIMFPHQVGSVDSTCSSWPGHVWSRDTASSSEYWLESHFNNNRNQSNGRERISVSSISSEASDMSMMSTDDLCMSSDNEDTDNINNSGTRTTTTTSSSTTTTTTTPPTPAIKRVLETTTQHPTPFLNEDQNNNFDQDTNNNDNTPDANYNTSTANNNTSNIVCKKNSKKSDSPSKTRLLDDEGYIRRAACVCLDETESKVLLVSSKRDPCSWLVPGGGMEAGEDMATAAIREAWEEAGVQGQITRYLGLFETTHENGHKKHRTAVFVVSVKQVMAEYPEAYLGRGRQWFPLEEALLHLARTRPLQSAYLQLLLVSRLKASAM